MTLSVIPVQSTTDSFKQQVEMDLAVYDLSFEWNARDAHWTMRIGKAGDTIIAGIKLVVSEDLLAYAKRIAGAPPGRMIIRDLDDLDRDPDGVLFGARVALMYDSIA